MCNITEFIYSFHLFQYLTFYLFIARDSTYIYWFGMCLLLCFEQCALIELN